MATARVVPCPHCGTGKTTKANPGIRLVCTSLTCGQSFRCPPLPAEGSDAPAAPPVTGGEPGPATTAPVGGPEVVRAKVKIGQVARPRERGQQQSDASEGAPADGDAGREQPTELPAEPSPQPPRVPNPTGKTGDLEQLRAAGRRGGLANYATSRLGRG